MRDRFNLAFPSLLLIGVALVQVVRAHTHGQSSWKGGGFGMFATSDSPGARFMRCIVVGKDGKEFRVVLPPRLGELGLLARVVPTAENVTEVAQEALALEWVREDYSSVQPLEQPAAGTGSGGGTALPGETPADATASRLDTSTLTYRALGRNEPKPPKELLLEVKAVRVEIWRTRLDPAGMKMEAVPVRSATAEE